MAAPSSVVGASASDHALHLYRRAASALPTPSVSLPERKVPQPVLSLSATATAAFRGKRTPNGEIDLGPGGQFNYLSEPVLQSLVAFLACEDVVHLAATDRFWWKKVGARVIVLVIDNTQSMRWGASWQLQEQFLIKLLQGLDAGAKLALRLVEPGAATEEWRALQISQRLVTPREALRIVETLIAPISVAADGKAGGKGNDSDNDGDNDGSVYASAPSSDGIIDSTVSSAHKNSTCLLQALAQIAHRRRQEQQAAELQRQLKKGTSSGFAATMTISMSSNSSLSSAAQSCCEGFYEAGTTPLLQCLCSVVNQGFRQIICVTDGEEQEITSDSAFGKLTVMGATFATIIERYNGQTRTLGGKKKQARKLTFSRENPLASWCEVIFAALPEMQAILATVVGINNQVLAADIQGMTTMNVTSLDKAEEAAHAARRQTVPREYGGGAGSEAAPALLGKRAVQIEKHRDTGTLASTLCERCTVMPDPTSHAARQQLLGQRVLELQELEKQHLPVPSQWLVRQLPPVDAKGKRKAGWTFVWQHEMNGTSSSAAAATTASASASASTNTNTNTNAGASTIIGCAVAGGAASHPMHTTGSDSGSASNSTSTNNCSGGGMCADDHKHIVNTDSANGNGSGNTTLRDGASKSEPLVVQELRLTHAETAREWAQICSNPKQLLHIKRLACEYTLQRYIPHQTATATTSVSVALPTKPKSSKKQSRSSKSKAKEAATASASASASATANVSAIATVSATETASAPKPDAAAVVTIDHLLSAQEFVSPIESDYDIKMQRRQEALNLLAKAKIYPMPAPLFFWLRYRPTNKESGNTHVNVNVNSNANANAIASSSIAASSALPLANAQAGTKLAGTSGKCHIDYGPDDDAASLQTKIQKMEAVLLQMRSILAAKQQPQGQPTTQKQSRTLTAPMEPTTHNRLMGVTQHIPLQPLPLKPRVKRQPKTKAKAKPKAKAKAKAAQSTKDTSNALEVSVSVAVAADSDAPMTLADASTNGEGVARKRKRSSKAKSGDGQRPRKRTTQP